MGIVGESPLMFLGVRMEKTMRSVRLIITAVFVFALMSLGSVALAQSTGGNVQPPGIGGEQVNPSVKSEQPAGTLPFTGADLSLFVAIGVGAIGAGSMMIRRTRKARSV
jgi:LPXTG-motif cell wall-anchored protein